MKSQIFYRSALCSLAFLVLAACDARPKSEISGRSLLDAFVVDGPEVTGVSDAMLQTAVNAEKDGNYGRALGFYKQLVDKDPENLRYRLGLADSLRRAGDLDAAIANYQPILAKNANYIAALEGKGLAYIAKGEFTKASPLLEKVMTQDAKRWRGLNGVGLLFVAKGLPKEALAYFNSALAQAPDNAAILNNKGLTLALLENYSQAIDTLRTASARTKNGTQNREQVDLNMALVYGLSGDLSKAEEVAKRHLSPEGVANNLGFYAYLADNTELAKAYLNSALSGSKTFYERAWKNLEALNSVQR